jgi:spore germination protein YaaH
VDGVDVDWEALTAEQRGRYAAFVEELARRLHRDGRLIAVDVYPKTREPGWWGGAGRARRTGGVWAGPSTSSA